MKTKIIILFCIVSLYSTAQEISKLNIGIDFSVVTVNNEKQSEPSEFYPIGGLYVEKPVQLKFLKSVSLNPGISYKIIKEKSSFGGLGAGGFNNLNHHSLSGYLKIINRIQLGNCNSNLYFGALTGLNVFTREKGSRSGHSKINNDANWTESDYKESP